MKIWIEIEDTQLDIVKEALAAKAGVDQAGKKKDTEKKGKSEPKAETVPPVSGDYENMKAADLYKLCCERGISSQCKKRDKASLIAVLKANESGSTKKEEETDDEWPEEDQEEAADPYEGKSARELYKMCVDRGLDVEMRKKPEVYVKALRAADAAGYDGESDEWPEEEKTDEWNID